MNSKTNPLRFLWVFVGFLCLALGTIGVVLPILPTVPFYMATLFCFAKSSEKLHSWFISTGLYKKHLESFVQNRSMTIKSKCTIMGKCYSYYGIGFYDDEQSTNRKNMSCDCLGVSCALFCFLYQD